MAATFDPDDEPPAYSEIAPPSASSSSSPSSRFPDELNLYFPSGSFFLGTGISQPLYSVHVSYRQVIPVEVQIVLRTGPDAEFPPFATLSISGRNARVWAPKQDSDMMDMSRVSISQVGPTGLLGTGYGSYVFAVPARDSSGLVEEYVWKHSMVPDILQVKAHWTLSRKPPSSSSSSSGGASGSGGAGSRVADETVATLSFKKDSRSKIGTIRFEGSGASGELGDRWAVVAILTALAIWQHKPGE
ncbi:hypothetical protein F5B17DRAFT_385651 [Nemania serpens]|nr:hypothetical protein F5B17DRAFT_385651 [Nemania serpens]